MEMGFSVSIFAFCFLLLIGFIQSDVPSTLRHVQILCRHGDRTPNDNFPTNPYGPDTWPNGFNQITQLGMRQMRDLGLFLRNRYGGWLNGTYVKKELFVRSTDLDRTLMSAQSLLAGLYPPVGFQRWDEDINWQPLPIHTRPLSLDVEMTVDNDCPRYWTLFKAALESPEAKQLLEENEDLVAYVKEHAGWDNGDLQDMFDTYDPLFCMMQHNRTLPSWANEPVLNGLENFYFKEADFWYYYDEQIYLKAGPFLRMVTSYMKDIIANTSTPGEKMHIYSSHDSLIAGALLGMDQWNGIVSPYASAILFELHELERDRYEVRTFYKNDTATSYRDEPIQLNVRECGNECKLEDFMSVLDPYIFKGSMEDLNKECSEAKNSQGGMVAVYVISICIVLVVTVVIAYIIKRHKTSVYISA